MSLNGVMVDSVLCAAFLMLAISQVSYAKASNCSFSAAEESSMLATKAKVGRLLLSERSYKNSLGYFCVEYQDAVCPGITWSGPYGDKKWCEQALSKKSYSNRCNALFPVDSQSSEADKVLQNNCRAMRKPLQSSCKAAFKKTGAFDQSECEMALQQSYDCMDFASELESVLCPAITPVRVKDKKSCKAMVKSGEDACKNFPKGGIAKYKKRCKSLMKPMRQACDAALGGRFSSADCEGVLRSEGITSQTSSTTTSTTSTSLAVPGPNPTLPWITRKAGTTWLMQGTNQFRFFSVNCPYVLYIPDAVTETVPNFKLKGVIAPTWKDQPYGNARFPTFWEIEDAFRAVQQMGGTVLRVFSFPVQNPKLTPKVAGTVSDARATYWILKDQNNEASGLMWNPNCTVIFDYVIQMAHKYQIYIIPAFINEWDAGGGLSAFCQAYGTSCPQKGCTANKQPDTRIHFYSNVSLMNEFLNLIGPLVAKYKDEPAILGWETGNELGGSGCPVLNTPEFAWWTRNVTAKIKQMAPNGPLAIDGSMFNRDGWYRPDDNIDVLDLHLYPNSKQEPKVSKKWLPELTAIAEKNEKAVFFGEVICHTDTCLQPLTEAFLAPTAINASGVLVWALSHQVDSAAPMPPSHFFGGGFFYHQETPPCAYFGERYFNYHWPGFPENDFYNESKVMAIVQYGAAKLAGQQVTLGNHPSPLPQLLAPVLTDIQLHQPGPGNAGPLSYYLYYTGSTGAQWYEIALKKTGRSNFKNLTQKFYPIAVNSLTWKQSNYTRSFPPALLGTWKQLGSAPCAKMIAKNLDHTSSETKEFCFQR